MGMPIQRTITSGSLDVDGNITPWRYDSFKAPFQTTIEVVIPPGSAATVVLQNTIDDLNAVPPLPTYTIATANWVNDSDWGAATVTTKISLTRDELFGRLNVQGLTGTIYLRVVQPFAIS